MQHCDNRSPEGAYGAQGKVPAEAEAAQVIPSGERETEYIHIISIYIVSIIGRLRVRMGRRARSPLRPKRPR